MDILAIVKALLKITDDEQDVILMMFIDMNIQTILNYCNLKKFPEELNFALVKMVTDTYYENSLLTSLTHEDTEDTIGDKVISSVSEGGRTVSFDTKDKTALAMSNLNILKSNANDRISKITELSKYKQLYR